MTLLVSAVKQLHKLHNKSNFSLDLQEARRVLDSELHGLQGLKESLNGEFIEAINILETTPGRVVITGMGKSGHIGRKIASTLASTGTPSFFIHPAEASHGDLGMIMKGDTLIAISNSGETKELAEIITFSKANRLPLIAITKNRSSTLAHMSTICLLLPGLPEACPLELAPTTSSMMTLALGDALAMVLLKRRGFTSTDFGRLHPGGKLGARLVRIDKVMHHAHVLPLVPVHMLMKDVLLVMTSKSFGCAGVIDDKGILIGMVTDGDLRRHMGTHLLEQKAEDIMTRSPKTLPPYVLLEEATAFMNENAISGTFVVDENKRPLGFIHLHDCLKKERL